MTLGDTTTNTNSDLMVGTIPTINCPGFWGSTGYIQRAHADKIYIAHCEQSYISVINDPNQSGVLCNLVNMDVALTSNLSAFGLFRGVGVECMQTGKLETHIEDVFNILLNSSNGKFNLTTTSKTAIKDLKLKIYDTLGQLFFQNPEFYKYNKYWI